MIEITYLREMEKVKVLQVEVQGVIRGVLEILDSEYGSNRDKYADDGGYVIVVESQISNIVNAISQGFVQEEFKIKMEDLKKRKADIEFKLSEMESREVSKVITEADVRALLSDFSGYVISRNIPECKKLIRDFVKEAIIVE
ncbi:hypothetical protein HYH38_04250 [Clostridium botulinum]|uniref:hypothetical protein n=1 Tax=Clostridium botulinum TaxID=1491 RepID=UPI000174EAF0|nr:hypothetical protein [Clostridium botulinum]ACD53679.1 hypothetical protein CLH_1293 [Clostridium botulinum E3 str. Alaska E43]MBY6789565.1 hypothetical protein [Clostridium botulinum]MBY6817248.1 hypothetical protein [Clostridium botulinum]MBY6826497.1 hypothetical protein [Clostridium botulinum]MBY6858445.1 hypothetical protein [Clostridium botulinum]